VEPTPLPRNIDPIRLEVIKNALDMVADQMALILMRTAYSAIVRDSMDYSTAICDRHGLTLAQGLTTPLHLGSFFDAMQHLRREYGDEVHAGDVFIGNDPYRASGQHLPDIYIVKPVFDGERLCGWATTLAHHADVGGIIPGSNALGATEIFQEGLRLPFLKLYSRGHRSDDIWKILEANIRIPDLVLGDLEAQIVAAAAGEQEYLQLVRHHGIDNLETYTAELHDYAEQLARREIADIPDGTYGFIDHIDGLGEDPQTITLDVRVTVNGERVEIDWTGTSPQVRGGVNSPFPFTKAAAYTALRSIMTSDVPNCHGFTRPIAVQAPPGTVVNPLPPSACGARGITGFRMIDCLFGALAQAVPHRVAADGSGGATLPTFAGYRNGKPFVFSETLMGNWGGTIDHDGQEGVPHMGANQSNVPIELIEIEYPIRIERYGLVPDTGGPGKHRGGLALVRDYRILQDDVLMSVRSDKRRYPPHGLFGGGAGAPSMNLIDPGAAERTVPTLVVEPITLNRGALFRHIMAGGGGYGDPFERLVDDVLQDVIEGKITPEHARTAYGVVVVRREGYKVDEAATAELRRWLRDQRAQAC
jgi:N-methylhydantoinase B